MAHRRTRRRPASSRSGSPCQGSCAPPTASCATLPTSTGSTRPSATSSHLCTGLPTVVGNDASLGAIAEHLYGAARGIDDVVYLNGGASGIGGGLIVHGMPVAGAGGYAGEFGQNRPGIASDSDRRAEDGVLEDEVSQRASAPGRRPHDRGPADPRRRAVGLRSIRPLRLNSRVSAASLQQPSRTR